MKTTSSNKNKLTSAQIEELFSKLKLRFDRNMNRHPKLEWTKVQAKLELTPGKLLTLFEMEISGGEPDVVSYDNKTGEYCFYDCASETPQGRRSLCYDAEALNARKENKPRSSAQEMAGSMGIELLNEEQYRELQTLGNFDAKTSSWIQTPPEVRKLGGALFCDRRFGRVFTYHNGAESYYAGRGFRGIVRV